MSQENTNDIEMVDVSSLDDDEQIKDIDKLTKMDDESASKTDEKEPIIGIDLGTTYSCVYAYHEENLKIVTNEEGKRTTPSYVAFTETDCLIGQPAMDQAEENPGNTIYDIKRLMGIRLNDPDVETIRSFLPYKLCTSTLGRLMVKVKFCGRDKYFFPEEISALILIKLKRDAEKLLGRPVKYAVITVPEHFNVYQRNATICAGKLAGLHVLGLLNEPTAAALSYGISPRENEYKNVLVFDLGGGTFDVTVLALGENVIEVKKTAGDRFLGGEDFVINLMKHCLIDIKEQIKNKDFDVEKDLASMQLLRNRCEDCKRSLSTSKQKTISLSAVFAESGEPINFKKVIKREDFVKLNSQAFDDAIETVEEVLKDANLSTEEIDDIILVGGSTRIPEIQKRLEKLFNKKELCHGVHVDEVVAQGAALRGAIWLSKPEEKLHRWVFHDVTTYSLGFKVGVDKRMCFLIRRGEKLPATSETVFAHPHYDYQTNVSIHVFEGENDFTTENKELCKFRLENITSGKTNEVSVGVKFTVDEDGLLTAEAEETASGKKASTNAKITLDGTFSPEEIETRREKLEKFFVENEESDD